MIAWCRKKAPECGLFMITTERVWIVCFTLKMMRQYMCTEIREELELFRTSCQIQRVLMRVQCEKMQNPMSKHTVQCAKPWVSIPMDAQC